VDGWRMGSVGAGAGGIVTYLLMAFELPFRAIPQTTSKGTGIKVMFNSSKC